MLIVIWKIFISLGLLCQLILALIFNIFFGMNFKKVTSIAVSDFMDIWNIYIDDLYTKNIR